MNANTYLLFALGMAIQPVAYGGSAGAFVLGVDGMDPVITERMMKEGHLPNLAQIAEHGSFKSLGTTTPPQSPVAWSTFITGTDPGGHGLFDFIHRDPKTYQPISSATPPPGEPGATFQMFGYVMPLSMAALPNNRSGTPFWDTLHSAGVDVEVYRIPGNYPTPDSKARVLAGMGTVDMRGGYGTYTWITDTPRPDQDKLKGDIQVVTVADRDLDGSPDTAVTSIKGPPDIFHLKPGQIPGPKDYLTTPVTLHIDPETDTLLAEVGAEKHLLQEGEWSDWIPVNFSALPLHVADLEGRVQIYVKEIRPNLQVYVSPVNIAPGNPAQVISSPADFATDLYEIVGDYYTQGMPEETNALTDGLFTDDDYIQQVARVQADTQELLKVALTRFSRGDTTFFYLSDIDLQCHMLWRHGDPKYQDAPLHPANEPQIATTHKHDIEGYYRHVDQLVGEVRKSLPSDTLLLIMSDHGFQPYTRKAHLNAWLRDNGWLTLKDGKSTGYISSDDVDWSQTKAYALGFNGLYINREGREGQGSVPANEVKGLKTELTRQLLSWKDGEEGPNIVLEVADSDIVYSKARRAEAPDLIVGYNVHYGASEESTLGEITEITLEDNKDRWSGNHLMAPSVVPGVVFSTQPIHRTDSLSLPDITTTLLEHYGLSNTAGMVGKSIFR